MEPPNRLATNKTRPTARIRKPLAALIGRSAMTGAWRSGKDGEDRTAMGVSPCDSPPARVTAKDLHLQTDQYWAESWTKARSCRRNSATIVKAAAKVCREA